LREAPETLKSSKDTEERKERGEETYQCNTRERIGSLFKQGGKGGGLCRRNVSDDSCEGEGIRSGEEGGMRLILTEEGKSHARRAPTSSLKERDLNV